MSESKLTIGMAHFDDFAGLWPTIHGIADMHPEVAKSIEILVIDNNPTSAQADMARDFIGKVKWRFADARWIAMDSPRGTSPPRDRVFREAAADYVMCIDPHISIAAGAIARLIEYIDANPGTLDLLQGPLVGDDGNLSTHFAPIWSAEMYGVWEIDREALAKGKPFDIPGQGLGLFACRKDAWVGFHPALRGFGGEELMLHEKVRRAGGRTLCLPWLKWTHRFGRASVPYPIQRWEKVRNYVIWHNELGLPLDPVRDHFCSLDLGGQILPEHIVNAHGHDPKSLNGKGEAELRDLHQRLHVTPAEWEYLVADPINREGPPGSLSPTQIAAGGISLNQVFDSVRSIKRDLDQHMPKLRELASQCDHVTEFSKRRESAIAFAAAKPKQFVSHNAEAGDAVLQVVAKSSKGIAIDAKSSDDLEAIEPTDLLFLKTIHTGPQLAKELGKFADSVRRYIVLGDTVTHIENGEGGGPGYGHALRPFVAENPEWFVAYHTRDQFGLTVLSRNPEDRPDSPIVAWPPGFGPGTELGLMLKDIGINPKKGCGCYQLQEDMDYMGCALVRERTPQIIKLIKEKQENWGWAESMANYTKLAVAAAKGFDFPFDPLEPYTSFVDEAIRRADVNEQARKDQAA